MEAQTTGSTMKHLQNQMDPYQNKKPIHIKPTSRIMSNKIDPYQAEPTHVKRILRYLIVSLLGGPLSPLLMNHDEPFITYRTMSPTYDFSGAVISRTMTPVYHSTLSPFRYFSKVFTTSFLVGIVLILKTLQQKGCHKDMKLL